MLYAPVAFFLYTFIIDCLALFTAAYASYHSSWQHYLFPLILMSMSSPTISALIMFACTQSAELWSEFCKRLHPCKIRIRLLPFLLFFMPCMVLLAIAISFLFGFSSEQFLISQLAPDQALEGKNLLAIVLIVLLSCSLEEIGWRGYGIESFRSRYTLWESSWIFALLWSLWHVPSFFIKNGYFQQEVWNLGLLYVATYFITLIPVTFIINWAYMKNNRSIISAILMHGTMNLSIGLFQIQPFTKIIFMILMLLAAVILVTRDKQLFFERNTGL